MDNYIVSLKHKMLELSGMLDQLPEEPDFDGLIGKINQTVSEVKSLKRLAGELTGDTEYDEISKLIDIKFDNIVSEMKTERDSIGLELSNIQNRKKLANYIR
ncbi:MAG: hypothetical protein ACM3SM_02815 [Bacteroidota bacterium]